MKISDLQYERASGNWVGLDSISSLELALNPEVRIKPTPKPTPNLRAFHQSEVPVGALYKWCDHVSIIIAVDDERLFFVGPDGEIRFNFFNSACLLDDSQISRDNGLTWQPCGVLEEAV